MTITLADIGKRFNREWIFKDISQTISKNCICAITGPNGSGKSTLLKLIALAELPTEGEIQYNDKSGRVIQAEKAYKKLSYAAPYIDLPEHLSLRELFRFHKKFIPLKDDLSLTDFCKITFLERSKDKQILYFSSGMKQRLKLGLALLSESEVVILDEPTSNLDNKGVELYNNLLTNNSKNRILIIASNEAERELSIANQAIELSYYKKFN